MLPNVKINEIILSFDGAISFEVVAVAVYAYVQ